MPSAARRKRARRPTRLTITRLTTAHQACATRGWRARRATPSYDGVGRAGAFARPTDPDRMASPQPVRTETRRTRQVKLCAPEVLLDRRSDGTIYLKSGRTLPDYPDKLTDRLI